MRTPIPLVTLSGISHEGMEGMEGHRIRDEEQQKQIGGEGGGSDRDVFETSLVGQPLPSIDPNPLWNAAMDLPPPPMPERAKPKPPSRPVSNDLASASRIASAVSAQKFARPSGARCRPQATGTSGERAATPVHRFERSVPCDPSSTRPIKTPSP